MLVAAVVLGFEATMFVHMLKSKLLSRPQKLLWVLAFVILHTFAALYYYFSRYRHEPAHRQESTA